MTDPVQRDLNPQRTLSIRASIPTAQLQQAQDERFKAISAHLNRHGIKPAGSPYVRYHTFNNTETDMEIGVPVSETASSTASSEGEIVSGELPGGPAISTVHIGAHDRLGDAYARLSQWQQQNGRKASSPGWEIYEWIDIQAYNPGQWPPPAEWRTELVQPITTEKGA